MLSVAILVLAIQKATFAPVGGSHLVATLDSPKGTVAYSNFVVTEDDLPSLCHALDVEALPRDGERPLLRRSKAQATKLASEDRLANEDTIAKLIGQLKQRETLSVSAETEVQAAISTLQRLPNDFSESSRAAVRALLPVNTFCARLLVDCLPSAIARLPLGEPQILVSNVSHLRDRGLIKPEAKYTECLKQMRDWLLAHPLDDSHLNSFQKYAMTLLYSSSRWSGSEFGYVAFVVRDLGSLRVNAFLFDEEGRVMDGGSIVQGFALHDFEPTSRVPDWIAGSETAPIRLKASGRILQSIQNDLPVTSATLAQSKVASACLPDDMTLCQAILSDCVKGDESTKIICVLPGEFIGAISKEVNALTVTRSTFWRLLNDHATISKIGEVTVIRPKLMLRSSAYWSEPKDERRFWKVLREGRGRIGLQNLGDYLAAIGPGGFQSQLVDWAKRMWAAQAGGSSYGIEKEAALVLSERRANSLGVRRLMSMFGQLTQDIRSTTPRSIVSFWSQIESGRFELALASAQHDCFAVDPEGPQGVGPLAPTIFGKSNFRNIPFDYWPENIRVFSGKYFELSFTSTFETGATLHFTMDDSPEWGSKSSPWKEVIKLF